MNIIYIMGMPHSGKSTFIDSFHDEEKYIKIDILDSEVKTESTSRAFTLARIALQAAINKGVRENKDVIFEAPGLTRKQRAYFTRCIRNRIVRENGDRLIGVWVEAPLDDIAERISYTGHDGHKVVEEWHEKIELPSLDEPYDILYRVFNSGVDDENTYFMKQAKYHCGYEGPSLKLAQEKLEQWNREARGIEIPRFCDALVKHTHAKRDKTVKQPRVEAGRPRPIPISLE